MKLTSFAGVLLLGLSATAFANPYAGGSVGQVDYDADGFDNPTGFELYAGNTFNENIAVEVNYNDFGTAKDKYGVGAEISGDSVGVAAKIILPVADNLELYARAGMHRWNFDGKVPGIFNQSDNGSDPFFGAGITVKVNEAFGVGLRYTKFDIDNDDIAVTALNGELYF